MHIYSMYSSLSVPIVPGFQGRISNKCHHFVLYNMNGTQVGFLCTVSLFSAADVRF